MHSYMRMAHLRYIAHDQTPRIVKEPNEAHAALAGAGGAGAGSQPAEEKSLQEPQPEHQEQPPEQQQPALGFELQALADLLVQLGVAERIG